MAAENTEITQITPGNHEEHGDIHAELHECLMILRRIAPYIPMLERYAGAPAATLLATRRDRRNGR